MSKELVPTKELSSRKLIEEDLKKMGIQKKTQYSIIDESAGIRSNEMAVAGCVGAFLAVPAAFWAGITYSSSWSAMGIVIPIITLSLIVGARITGTKRKRQEKLSIALSLEVKDDLKFNKGEFSNLAGAYSIYLSRQVEKREIALSYGDFLNSAFLESFENEFVTMKFKAEKDRESEEAKQFNNPRAIVAHASIAPKQIVDYSAQYRKLVSKYSDIKRQWIAIQSDIVQLLKYPMISDINEPLVRSFHKELIRAENLLPDDLRNFDMNHPFIDCISNLELSYQSMMSEAKKISDSKFSPAERKKILLAKKLIDIALNSASTASERQSAYKKAMEQLKGLVVIPEIALKVVEGSVTRLEIDI